VDLSDYGAFGLTWAKCEGDSSYNKWFDFFKNDCVDLSDNGLFGSHWQCSYSDSLGAMLGSGNMTELELEVLEGPDEGGVLKVEVKLNTTDYYNVMAMLLQTDGYDLMGWESQDFMAVQVDRQEGRCVFIGSLNSWESGRETCTLGTLTLKESGNRNLATKSESTSGLMRGISLIAGEVMTTDGKISRIASMEVKEQETPVVYRDKLWDNYPNPFNPITTIRYSVSKECRVSLKIFNVRGQLIRTLVDGQKKMGEYEVKWNGTNNKGNGLASGVYFYRLEASNFIETKKMVLLR